MTLLLNKLQVLDKGHVALFSSGNPGTKLKELKDELFLASFQSSFLDIAQLTLHIKCPLFIQLYLSKFNIKIITIPPKGDMLEAFIPDLTDVAAADIKDSTAIADDIARTTAALHINPAAYQADGCDRFTSQLITPINTYTELIVHGSLKSMLELVQEYNDKVAELPHPIREYALRIRDIIEAEWPGVVDKYVSSKR